MYLSLCLCVFNVFALDSSTWPLDCSTARLSLCIVKAFSAVLYQWCCCCCCCCCLCAALTGNSSSSGSIAKNIFMPHKFNLAQIVFICSQRRQQHKQLKQTCTTKLSCCTRKYPVCEYRYFMNNSNQRVCKIILIFV